MWSLSLRFLYQNPVCISFVSCTLHMPGPSHSPRFYHLMMYVCQHLLLEKPSAFVLRLIKETSSHNQVKQEVKL
jgi:hypothetical protein